MKRILALILALCLVFALAACGGETTPSTAPSTAPESEPSAAPEGEPSTAPEGETTGGNVVKIGIYEPTTGASASGGKKEMLGMQYANAETPTVEIGGETYTVELVFADNGSTTDKAPSAASQLVNEGVAMVLGSYGSDVSIAGGPIFNDAGLAALGVTCTNPNVTAGNDY